VEADYNVYKILSGITELELLDLLKKVFPKIEKIEGNFSSIDCIDKFNNHYFELKCRYEHYATLYIEKEKYLKLNKKENSFYINSTPKGIYIFHIQALEEPIWREKYLPATSEFDNTNMIIKEIGELQISKAIEITQLVIK
jgi:hypothetical protein